MRVIFWIVWRYLWGRRTERFVSLISVISVLGVAIGVAALIVVLAVMSGFGKELKEKIIGNYSHLVIEAPFPITEYQKVLEEVRAINHVFAAAPFIQGQALLQTQQLSRGIVVRGIDLELEAEVTNICQYIASGRKSFSVHTDSKKEEESGIFIGRELGHMLGIGEGDKVALINPAGNRFTLQVSGIFNSGMYDFDTNIIFADLAKAQEMFELERAVNGIAVRIDKLFLADFLKEEIQQVIGSGYYVRTWIERNRSFFAALKLEKITMFIILTLIVLVAAFNIASTLVVMVTEKTKDIGILKSIGMTASRIRVIFTLEGLLIGFLGTGLGCAIGISLCALLKKYQFIKLPADIYFLDRLPVSLVFWPDVAIIVIAAFCISFLSTIYPAKKASRLLPVEALRYE
jgi:lipoprotein-releasing system permease protein